MPLGKFAYTIGGALSAGGFSDVFETVTADGQPAVVKVARRRGGDRAPTGGGHFPARGFRSSEPSGRWRQHTFTEDEVADVFVAEAATLRRASGHRLPHLLDRVEVNGRPALVLEKMRRSWDLASAAPSAFAELLEAAGELARTGISGHGDLKPEHVFLDGRGQFTFVDPGYYRTTPPLRVTTPEFNPKLLSGPASDVVAVAVMAFLRFVGELPWAANRASLPPRMAAVSPAPSGLAEWVDDLLRTPDDASLPPWGNDHFEAAAALRERLERPVVESVAFVVPRTDSHVSAHIPYGWRVTETWTLTGPRVAYTPSRRWWFVPATTPWFGTSSSTHPTVVRCTNSSSTSQPAGVVSPQLRPPPAPTSTTCASTSSPSFSH